MRFVLPGMGATSDMYVYPWPLLKETKFLDWPIMKDEITFESIARKLINLHNITSNDKLVGSSLGGIISLEIARQVKCKEVVLIGSAIYKIEINSFLLTLIPLNEVTPLKFIQFLAGKSGSNIGEMFAIVDSRFIRNTCRELRSWKGQELVNTNIYRIHGSNDQVIKCPEKTDLTIEGGHLIAMTHAQECIDFIKQINDY